MDRRIVADPGCAIPATRTRYLDTARAERGMERVTHAPRGMHPTRGGPEQQSTGRAPAGGMGRRRPAGGMRGAVHVEPCIRRSGHRRMRRAVRTPSRECGAPHTGIPVPRMRRAIHAASRGCDAENELPAACIAGHPRPTFHGLCIRCKSANPFHVSRTHDVPIRWPSRSVSMRGAAGWPQIGFASTRIPPRRYGLPARSKIFGTANQRAHTSAQDVTERSTRVSHECTMYIGHLGLRGLEIRRNLYAVPQTLVTSESNTKSRSHT